jgi:hypothetical protein
MFVQIITGRTTDAAKFRAQGEKWIKEVRPGAKGFLGGTGGVADDGRVVLSARFTDQAAAEANANRPEQSAFWEEMVKTFDGEPTFRETSDVDTMLAGGSDDAGFVQVMEGKVTDRAKAAAMETPEMMEQLRAVRPDVIGGMRMWFPDNSFVMINYFTSEAAAREGESKAEFQQPPEEMKDWDSVFGEMTFTDLRDPILFS